MGKNFKNINEELERMKTLIYETDNLILNEQPAPLSTDATDKFKTMRSSFKLAKVSDVNTVIRGGASKYDTYKLKGTGAINLFDKDGKMTPEGIELMKKSGLKLPAGQIVMRLGKVDDPNTDKVFFQVIPTKDVSIVTQSGDIKNVNTKELEKLPTVQDVKPKTLSPAGGGQDMPPTAPTTPTAPAGSTQKPKSDGQSTSPTGEIELKTFNDDDTLIGKKLEDLDIKFNLKITDVTPEFSSVGYKASAFYKKNEDTKSIYGVDKNGIIQSVFNRIKGSAPKLVGENLNVDLFFVNPLLFESVISEEEIKDYYVKTDMTGKKSKMSDKFTQVVDGTWKGGSTSGGSTSGGSTSGGGTSGGGTSGGSTSGGSTSGGSTSGGGTSGGGTSSKPSGLQDLVNKKRQEELESFDPKKLAMTLYTAFWRNDFNEDEDTIFNVFQNKIKNKSQFNAVLNAYKTLGAEGKLPRARYMGKTIQGSVKELFSSGEISRLNDYISKYTDFRF